MERALLCVVDVEEVRVENSLYNTSDNRNDIEVTLGEVSINPVRNVQCTVKTQGEKIVRSNRLCFSGSLKHEKLWEDRN